MAASALHVDLHYNNYSLTEVQPDVPVSHMFFSRSPRINQCIGVNIGDATFYLSVSQYDALRRDVAALPAFVPVDNQPSTESGEIAIDTPVAPV